MRDLKMNSDSCDCRTTQLPSGHQAVVVVLGTENLCLQLCRLINLFVHICVSADYW